MSGEPVYTMDGGFVGYSMGPSPERVRQALQAQQAGDVGVCATCKLFTSRPKDAAGNRYCEQHNARSGAHAEGVVRLSTTSGSTVYLFANDRLHGAFLDYAVVQSGAYDDGSLVRVRCLSPGVFGNRPPGASLMWAAPRAGVAAWATIEPPGLCGGVDPGALPAEAQPLSPADKVPGYYGQVQYAEPAPKPLKCTLDWCDRLAAIRAPFGYCSDLCADTDNKRRINLRRLRDFCERVKDKSEQAWAAAMFNEENERLSNRFAALRHEPLRGDESVFPVIDDEE